MTKSGKDCVKRRNCTFCAISTFVTVFKKSSAAEASESDYMRERVNSVSHTSLISKICKEKNYIVIEFTHH